jgi:hypothetical protein
MTDHTGEELQIIAILEVRLGRKATPGEIGIALAHAWYVGELDKPPTTWRPGT